MLIQPALKHLILGKSLSEKDMGVVLAQVMRGETTQAQIAALLTALRMKGEVVEEVLGAVTLLRSMLTPVQVSEECLIDCCGTGGDGANLFNISTASAFVAAAAGAKVAKHGNRSVSSNSGSADVLEAAGIELDLSPRVITQGIEQVGVGFIYAPAHHSALKYASSVRKELGFRTLFNMVGPLINPACVKRQVIGVYDIHLCSLMAEVLKRLGSQHVLVVHAQDGLDELSLADKTHVCELKGDRIQTYEVTPETFGIKRRSLEGLSVTDAASSWALIESALSGASGEVLDKARDIIAMNAGAAIYVSGRVATWNEGVIMAQALVRNHSAIKIFQSFRDFTQAAKKGSF